MAKQYIEVNGHNIQCLWKDGQKRKIDDVNIECIQDYLEVGFGTN